MRFRDFQTVPCSYTSNQWTMTATHQPLSQHSAHKVSSRRSLVPLCSGMCGCLCFGQHNLLGFATAWLSAGACPSIHALHAPPLPPSPPSWTHPCRLQPQPAEGVQQHVSTCSDLLPDRDISRQPAHPPALRRVRCTSPKRRCNPVWRVHRAAAAAQRRGQGAYQ